MRLLFDVISLSFKWQNDANWWRQHFVSVWFLISWLEFIFISSNWKTNSLSVFLLFFLSNFSSSAGFIHILSKSDVKSWILSLALFVVFLVCLILWAQSFNSLMTDLCQDINRVSSFSRCRWTFFEEIAPLRHWYINSNEKSNKYTSSLLT